MSHGIVKFLIPVLTVLLIASIVLLGVGKLTHDHYRQLEARHLADDVQKVRNLLQSEMDNLAATTRDYATWDDAWQFLHAPDQRFVDINLDDSLYGKLRIDLLAYLDLSGNVIHATSTLPDGSLLRTFDGRHLDLFRRYGGFGTDSGRRSMSGFTSTPDGLFMLVVEPVLRSNGAGQPAGFLMMGRRLGKGETQRLSRLLMTPLSLSPVSSPPSAGSPLLRVETREGPIEIFSLANGSLSGRSVIVDPTGEPVAVLNVSRDNRITREVISSFDLILFASTTIAALLIILLLLLFIRHVEIRRKGEASEQKLKESELRFGSVFRNAGLAIIIASPDRTILDCNPFAERFLGYTREEMIGLTIGDLSVPEDERENVQRARETLEKNDCSFSMEKRYRTKDGRIVWGNLTVSYLRSETGALEMIVGMIEDITPRKIYEERLTRLNQELERKVEERTADLRETIQHLESFTYSISHDLRTPLRAIDGYLNILREDYSRMIPSDALPHFDRISHNARLMADLIDDLLAFSRVNRAPLSKIPFDMNALVEEVIQQFDARSTPGVTLVVDLLPQAHGDPRLIRQVVANLLENSLKYRADDRPLEIRIDAVSEPGGGTVYRFADNGIGFDMRYADRIFGVFERIHPDRPVEGTGIGLALAKEIVERHGGKIWVESSEGRGSTFFFTLGVCGLSAPE